VGSGSGGAFKLIESMVSAGDPRLVTMLGVRSVTEEVMYDKCQEFLGCFPEKVKFEEMVACSLLAVAVVTGAFVLWKSGQGVSSNQVAPALSQSGEADKNFEITQQMIKANQQPSKMEKVQVRAAFKHLSI
jgi:hypothetical protein